MDISRRTLLLSGAATALAACDPAQLGRQAGGDIDPGDFGNPTVHNRAVMTGQLDYTVAIAQRFAAEVPTTVFFDFDSTALDAEAQTALMRQAAWIRQFPELRFSVIGHTDLVGSERYNHALGRRRAEAVVRFLVAQGISRNRVRAIISRGQRQPLIATSAPERQNRRAVTQVSGFLRRHPTVMDGRYAEIIRREFIESATYLRPATMR